VSFSLVITMLGHTNFLQLSSLTKFESGKEKCSLMYKYKDYGGISLRTNPPVQRNKSVVHSLSFILVHKALE